MKIAWRQWGTVALIVAGVWFWEVMRPVGQPAGVLAPDPPRISTPSENAQVLKRDDHDFTPLARFESKARILGIKRYGRTRDERLAPLDLVLGWGRLSDSTQLKIVDVAQAERRALFQSYDPKLPDADMEAFLMNVHVLTADPEMEKRLKDLRIGNIVRIDGWLVEAVAKDGWRWKGQARERAPAAPGALLWVERVEIES